MKDGSASPLPLFYKHPMLLRSQEHGTFGLRRAFDFRFAADTAVVPLVASEFAPSSRHYPIVFASDDSAIPLAVLGMATGRNLFVDGEGQWRAGTYIPGYVRRYPFIAMTAPGTASAMLAVDSACPRIVTRAGDDAEPFFDAQGAPTPSSLAAMTFCEAYRREADQIGAFIQALKDHDLLVERTLRVSLTGARDPKATEGSGTAEAVVNGFRTIDEAKFRALPAEVAAQFHAKGWTDLVVLHLSSQLGWQALMAASAATAPEAAAA